MLNQELICAEVLIFHFLKKTSKNLLVTRSKTLARWHDDLRNRPDRTELRRRENNNKRDEQDPDLRILLYLFT